MRLLQIFALLLTFVPSLALAKPALRIEGTRSGQTLTVTDYRYALNAGRTAVGFEIVKDSDATALRHLTEANRGAKLVFSIGSETTALPLVRDATLGRSFELSFSDVKSFEAVKEALAREP